MAITITRDASYPTRSWGGDTVVIGTFSADADYRTGGYDIDFSLLGITSLTSMIIEGAQGYSFEYIEATKKLKIYAGAGAGGTTGATSGGTPAGTVAAPTVSSDSAGTPAGTNAVSSVTATYLEDHTGITKPTIALTHNADPVVNLAATALYITEALGGAAENCAVLQSNNDGGVSVLGETADGSYFGGASSARFWVTHSNAPTGVQIYVNEAASYRLEAVLPSGTNAVLVLPMENPNGYGAPYVNVTVYYSATAATGKPLYFDDNGAADAQLCFVAGDTANHAIPAGDVLPSLGGATTAAAGQYGVAAAQVFTGSALGNHTHTAGAPAFTGSALGTHTHTVGAMSAAEVADHTNLATLTLIGFIAIGKGM